MNKLFFGGCKDRWDGVDVSPKRAAWIREKANCISLDSTLISGMGNWCTLPGVTLGAITLVVGLIVVQVARRVLFSDAKKWDGYEKEPLFRWSVNKFLDGGVKNVLLSGIGFVGVGAAVVVAVVVEIAVLPFFILSIAMTLAGIAVRLAWAIAPYILVAIAAGTIAAAVGAVVIGGPALIGLAVGAGIALLTLSVGFVVAEHKSSPTKRQA